VGGLCEVSPPAVLVRRQPFIGPVGQGCRVGCQLHVNFHTHSMMFMFTFSTGFPWRVPPSSVRRRLSWWVPPDVVCGRVQACLLFVGASAVKALRD